MNGDNATIGVVGAGLMGVGIATRIAVAGHRVLLHDDSTARLRDAHTHAAAILGELRDSGAIAHDDVEATLERLSACRGIEGLRDVPTVFEAVSESAQLKRGLYAQLENIVSPRAVIASNTSGLLPDQLSAEMTNPERFAVAHFWNPPHAIPLVEVVPASRTSKQVTQGIVLCLKRMGMEPVLLEHAIPGFIGNRLQFAVLREALHIVRAGVADPATIDTVMKACLGRRYSVFGPFEGADLGGLDTILGIAGYLMPALAKDEEVLELLRERVDRGETGIATGQGFYEWTAQRKALARQSRLKTLSGGSADASLL